MISMAPARIACSQHVYTSEAANSNDVVAVDIALKNMFD
jgi:hypothetical protein